ncbi:uncharacterized protein BO95DRAFT_170388 [Aspergillus brunneoviolaceus CBS 621.78]|uniref:Uncharacterized protein n=1 Tax=Aspergillus brunneoviolaceus CBS 621.78 TaxID=1450534 RepID=A0ACD1G5I5_9EURO|nr:hypothetical protein BO95DRAFT_170388 [Aspergillus brunneoviolaceus CBS 621.78]RAH44520.1 hypothetical protein BO95DRAFT_170388 [Aspergillus brunneoviolaceus CBS 621.78]
MDEWRSLRQDETSHLLRQGACLPIHRAIARSHPHAGSILHERNPAVSPNSILPDSDSTANPNKLLSFPDGFAKHVSAEPYAKQGKSLPRGRTPFFPCRMTDPAQRPKVLPLLQQTSQTCGSKSTVRWTELTTSPYRFSRTWQRHLRTTVLQEMHVCRGAWNVAWFEESSLACLGRESETRGAGEGSCVR